MLINVLPLEKGKQTDTDVPFSNQPIICRQRGIRFNPNIPRLNINSIFYHHKKQEASLNIIINANSYYSLPKTNKR
nr:hypothetical protein [Shigella boydii]